ncbi:MAG: hypothetical protein KJZ87_04085 [Thermoguttaceae bacterium]|nr:hypothetical protein [Thermoguttaceae bacterium]
MLQQMEVLNGKVTQLGELAGNVLVYINPNEAERKYLSERLRIEDHTLASALDPNEMAVL